MTPTALVLAAGKGTRMRSSLSKVLHPLCGRPLAAWTLQACQDAGLRTAVVVGHQAEQVQRVLGPDHGYAIQAEQKGTGHAVQCAQALLSDASVVLVLPGDAPLITAQTLRDLLAGHGDALCTLLTFETPDPGRYGRIIRDSNETVLRIVEADGATAEQLSVNEVNAGIYAFDAQWLVTEVLPHLKPSPPKGELYLTDAIEAASRAGRLRAVIHQAPEELVGINDKATLAQAEADLRERINHGWMMKGVHMRDPKTTYIDAQVTLGAEVLLETGVILRGETTIGDRATIGPHVSILDSLVGPDAHIKASSVLESAVVGPRAAVGPMAHLRAGSVLGAEVKVGNFVETKKAVLKDGAKASHLSYLGDCEVGAGANIGAGTITCNYDGWGKHKTRIGARAFVGSNASLVAPVSLGADSIVGAGSCITGDVPDGDLAIGRGRQKNLTGRAEGVHRRNAQAAGKSFDD